MPLLAVRASSIVLRARIASRSRQTQPGRVNIKQAARFEPPARPMCSIDGAMQTHGVKPLRALAGITFLKRFFDRLAARLAERELHAIATRGRSEKTVVADDSVT